MKFQEIKVLLNVLKLAIFHARYFFFLLNISLLNIFIIIYLFKKIYTSNTLKTIMVMYVLFQ